MASLVLGVVGGVVGFVASGGNPMGAMIGFQLGPATGSTFFPAKAPEVKAEHADWITKNIKERMCL